MKTKLEQICVKAKEYVDKNNEDEGILNQKSKLWSKIFDERNNFPSYKDFPEFIKDAYNTGTGNQKRTKEQEKQFSIRVKSLVKSYGVDAAFIEKIQEPDFGMPNKNIKHKTLKFSANYYRNLINAYKIYKKYKNRQDLVILEIGGGSGILTSILFQLLNIKKYILVDLPENLYLASVYLQVVLNEDITYLGDSDYKNTRLIASLPEHINNINFEIDLVVNTNSFGEMPKETVTGYLDFCNEKLKNNGVIYSHNRVGIVWNQQGPKYLSDFMRNNLYINELQNSPSNTFFAYDMHHIAFLSKRKNEISEKHIDVMGQFIKFGVNIDYLFNFELNSAEELNDFFNMFDLFFKEKNSLMQEQILVKHGVFLDNELEIIYIKYLILIKLTNNTLKKHLFKEYLNIPKANFSSTYSDIFIGLIAGANGVIKRNNLIGDLKKSNTPHYAEDIDLLLRNRTISFRGFVKKYLLSSGPLKVVL